MSLGIPVVPPESRNSAGSAGSMLTSASACADAARLAFQQFLQAHEPRVRQCLWLGAVRALHETQPQSRVRRHHLGRHRGEVEAAGGRGHGQRPRPGDLGELGDLPLAVPRQGQHGRGPDPLQREVEVGEHRRVRQLHDDPVQRPEAQVEQDPGQVRRALGQFAVGHRARLVHHRDPVGVLGQRPGEPLEQRLVRPVAPFPVAGGELGRDRRHPVKHEMTIAWDLTGVVTWQRRNPAASRRAPAAPASTDEADDVGAILDDMDEALEENPEEVVRSFGQEGGE